jgi:hypothetical protein
MKIKVFFLAFFLLLFVKEHYFHCNSSIQKVSNSSSQVILKKQLLKITENNSCTSLFEEADLDVEEECKNDETSANKCFSIKLSSFIDWFKTSSNQFLLNHSKKIFPNFCFFYSNSSPIYISQRVLRI